MSADMLARVYPVATDLLRRIDAEIERHGAPAEHPMWLALRRVGMLPAAAAEHFYWLAPDRVRGYGDAFRVAADRLAAAVASVPMVSWHGSGGQAYADGWLALSAYLGRIDDRLAASARFAGELGDWVQNSRDTMAVELATCIGSREAVSLIAGTNAMAGGPATAAAELGVRILSTAQDCAESGWALRERWAGRLDEVVWRSSGASGPAVAHHIDVS